MDHLAAPGIAEDGLDLAAVAAGDAARVGDVIGDEAAADFLAGRATDGDGIAPLETPLDAPDAGGKQALAMAQGGDGALVDDERAARLEAPIDPLLARCDRIGLGQKPGAVGALGDAAQ